MKKMFAPAGIITIAFCVGIAAMSVRAQTLLEADGTTNTYALIESVLGTGTADETPDDSHPEFGPHITQNWDDALGKYVFSFFIHVTPDDDRGINFDRQRNEIKTYGASPDYLKGFYDDTTTYRWYFKLADGFQPSPQFTHIHQIKAGDGTDAGLPVITITPRYGTPNQLEIIYTAPTAFGGGRTNLTTADLSGFEGQWIEANESILHSTNGTYALELKRVNDGTVLLSCTNNLNMWRADATFNRPKWGIYRSIINTNYLRDEEVRFADFCLAKGSDICTNTAPAITLDPVDQLIFWRQNATLTAAANGTPPLHYQWSSSTTNQLDWATNATLVITNAQSQNEGDYSVVVTSAYGAVTSAVAALTVTTASTNVYDSAGTSTWVCPDGVASVQVECWGGGGAGGSAIRPVSPGVGTGGGGAGGAYAMYNSYSVTPGSTYYINVGAGGVSLTNDGANVSGGDSWFNSTNTASTVILAKGGAGGESVIVNGASRYGAGGTGSASGSLGDLVYAGGSGATSTATSYGGGGGGSGGTLSAGSSAPANTGLGATAVGGGGNGGDPNPTASSSGSGQTPTLPPGGGGGGARSGSTAQRTGGAGAAGQVILTYAVNSAPDVELTAPTNGASFTAPADITLTATASDTDGTITTVDFYNGSTLIESDTSSPYTYTWTNVAFGSYSLTAVATDNGGAVRTSSVSAITVTNDAGSVVVTNVDIYTASDTWLCPDEVTSVQVECWGGGGAGGSAQRIPNSSSSQYGGGGAGGAYAMYNSYSVTPGNTYYINVGSGGANNSDINDTTVPGGDSWFNSVNAPSSVIIAKGGAGGESAVGNTTTTRYGIGGTGTAAGSAGDVVYAGGSGATGSASAAGGGGSSAGTNSAGTTAVLNIGATAPAGGGDGGTGPTTSSGNGGSGYTPGGGGSGARDATGNVRAGGTGGSGKIVLSYITVSSTASNVSATAASPVGDGSGTGGLTTYAQRTLIHLTETPSAGTPPFTYAWKKVGSETVLGTGSNLVVYAPVDGDQYTCDVAATWDGVTNTSPAATLTVTTAIDPDKVAIVKADDFRGPNQAWTDFIDASRDLGIQVGIGVICTNTIDPVYAAAEPAEYQSITNWMQAQESAGDIEFWNHAWIHSYYTDTNGTKIYEYQNSGLEYQQDILARSQAAIRSALGHDALAFGPPYNKVDADTATVINETPALKLVFVTSLLALPGYGLDDRVVLMKIIGESDGTGLPNAATFISTYPTGPAGPVALQFHPPVSAFTSNNSMVQYELIIKHLLANGYAILTPSEYIASLPAAASFSASPTHGGAPLTVTFTDSSLGTPTNHFWSFGDGSTTNVATTSLTHTYRFPGTNTVQLIVSDASGSSTNTQAGLIVATSVDTVGDGVPDWWRAQYFGGNGTTTNADSTATFDFDEDGLDNLAEYLADTVPTRAASRLALIGLELVGSDMELTWIGGSGAWQFVEYRNSLTDTNGWSAVYTNTPPTSVTNTLLDTGAGDSSSRFYRIKAER